MRSLDYDNLAETYDLRYERDAYRGVEAVVLRFLTGAERERCAEAGCSTGHWVQLAASRGIYVVGLDLSRQMLDRARRAIPNGVFCRGRATSLPWGKQVFHRILCINAVHHLGAADAFFRECRRVLVPGGGLLVVSLDPHLGRDRWFIYEYFDGVQQSDLVRYPSGTDIRRMMRDSGFQRLQTRQAIHFDKRLPVRFARSRGWLEQSVNSQLATLSPEDYEAGIERISAAEGVNDRLELVVDVRLWATAGWVDGDGG